MKNQRHHAIALLSIAILLASGATNNGLAQQAAPSAAAAQWQTGAEPSVGLGRNNSGFGQYVDFPSVGIAIRQPSGFEKADTFDGFGQPATQSSVVAFAVPGPYAQITAAFTPDHMRARAWTLLSREAVTVDGIPGILVHFEQPAGGTIFVKWSLVFGDERKTTMVTAAFPKALERELSAHLKDAVLSTRQGQAAPPGPGSDLPFTLTGSQKLKLTPGISNTLTYTLDGVLPADSPSEPLFIAGLALGNPLTTLNQEFAEWRLREMAHTKNLVIRSTSIITIAGLEGYESVADALDAGTGIPLVAYQVILFHNQSYILMQGLVGSELSAEYLPEFRAMARSLQRRRP